jgi:DNA-binding XRE family transcriptional regulator
MFMSAVRFNDHYNRVRQNPEMAALIDEEEHRLDAAVVLSQARESAGMTQEQLSEKANVSRSTINRIEKGRTIPSFRTMDALAKAMGRHATITIS